MNHPLFPIAIIAIALSGCATSKSFEIAPGMTKQEADSILQQCGATECKSAYSLPWGNLIKISPEDFKEIQEAFDHPDRKKLSPLKRQTVPESEPREFGYHTYHHLVDGTCVQLKIRSSTKPERVIQIFTSPAGAGYKGKSEWYKDTEVGINKVIPKLTLQAVSPDA